MAKPDDMMGSIDFPRARWLALLVPSALLGGALGSQYWGGLIPCEMCYWQRYPHGIAIFLALLALMSSRRPQASRLLTALAALAIATSGAIGVFHAGVEYGWWEGLTSCATSSNASTADELLADIMATPLIRCDQVQWSLLSISMAGWNAIISLGAAALILTGLRKDRA